MDAARTALRRVDEFTARLAEAAGGAKAGTPPGWAQAAETRFEAAMDEDLNVSAALAALFDAIREGNAALDAKALDAAGAAAVRDLFRRWDGALGVFEKPAETIPPAVQTLLDRQLPDGEREQIVSLATSVPGVHGIHDLRTRQSGPLRFIQLHLELDDFLPLVQAHELADRAEALIRGAFPGADVIIHMDPISALPQEDAISRHPEAQG